MTGVRCPQCRGPLTFAEAYTCADCARSYPVVCGIPDFRLDPDPYISFEEEYEKAQILEREAAGLDFEGLVRFYWRITPETPAPAAERYVRYALEAEARSAAALEDLDGGLDGRWTGRRLLDVGCGTGGMLVAARARFATVVGCDVALRWLVIARKRLMAAGSDAQLVCCSATRLPFEAGSFDAAVGLHLLEHSGDAGAVVRETARVLSAGGLCVFSTPNRLSLGPEPCVRVWGVGFLPRRLQPAYVRWVRGVPYRHIRLFSYFELRRLFAQSGFERWRIEASPISESERRSLPRAARVLAGIYERFRNVPGVAFALRVIGPMLRVVAQR